MHTELMKAAHDISVKLQRLEVEYQGMALGAFLVLENLDPDTAKLALDAHEDRAMAALWFMDRVGSLCGERPWDYLARGDVERVRWVLNAIIYGIPP
jgi:hypothetical protein